MFVLRDVYVCWQEMAWIVPLLLLEYIFFFLQLSEDRASTKADFLKKIKDLQWGKLCQHWQLLCSIHGNSVEKRSYLHSSTLSFKQGRKGVFGPYLHMLIWLSGVMTSSVKWVCDCATLQQCFQTVWSREASGMRVDVKLLLPFLDPSLISSPEGVFTADDVRGKLIAVFAVVTTNVAFQWIPVSVTTHVDGVHDVIQEKHLAVFALERP